MNRLNFFLKIIGIACLFLFSSCNNNNGNDLIFTENRSSDFNHSFNKSDSLFNKLYFNLTNKYGNNFIDSLAYIDTNEYHIIFNDLIQIGEIFLDSILEVDHKIFIDEYNVSNFELASLGIHVYIVKNYGDELGLRGDWVDCLSAATGAAGIKEVINISGLVSAKTGLQILKAVGKRYLGWVGLALMVYDFIECIE